MKRKHFLKGIGMAGLGLVVPLSKLKAENEHTVDTESCVLIPTETAGPFPLDLTTNEFYFRQDVRETQEGVQLNLKLKIIGETNCLPISNLRVNIWHCSKDGLYSGYDNAMNPGQLGLTYLRGYQITDANGEIEFITILPGWYNGRVCHIHFQVYVSTTYAAISQLTFDPETKNAIYAANPDLYIKGADPLLPIEDNIFSDGYTYQLSSLTPNATTGGYDGYLEVTIQGEGTLGIGAMEWMNAQHLTLGQNYPNPFSSKTTIPYSITTASDVEITLFDLNGNSVKQFDLGKLVAGEHLLEIDFKAGGIPMADYVYQISIKNQIGVFREYKLMTAMK